MRCDSPNHRVARAIEAAARILGRLLRLTMLCLAATPACAWNAGGHRLSAMIAWATIDAATRQAVVEVLRQHPDYERWQGRGEGADPGLTAFLKASTWPDEIRSDRRFYTAGIDAPTVTQPGFPDMERRLQWHYVDRPLDAGKIPLQTSGVLDRQLAELVCTLSNPKATLSERAWALPWLIHLVADAHQPLHAASRYAPDGRSDDGGNGFLIINPFSPRRPATNLHRYWDDLPAPPWLHGKSLERAAQALIAAYPPPASLGTPGQWIDESWWIARESAYPAGEVDGLPVLSEQFHEQALAIARRRVAESGYRLANLLGEFSEISKSFDAAAARRQQRRCAQAMS